MLLALTLGFFNPIFRGEHFSTVPAHHSAVYPWAGLPSNGVPFFPQSDQADLSHPWHTFLTDALDDGSFPFWDPHSYGGGYPLFANGSSAPLYPPRLLTALTMDPVRAHDVFVMLHVLLSGLLMFALMREFEVGHAGALLAAVSWMFAGFNMAWLHLEVMTPMSVFLPLGLLCVHRAHRTGSWASTVLAGLALGGTLMSGHVVLLGLVYMVTAGYAVALAAGAVLKAIRGGNWREGVPVVVRCGAAIGISLGFAMVVLLPTGYALSGSHREPFSYDELVTSFLAPARTLRYAFVAPPLPVTQDRMHEMTFAGTATGLLAMAGCLVRRRGAWLARVLFAAAFLIALGTPATWFAYHVIPGFDVFRPYSRLLVFSTFALAVLGGFGLDALSRRARQAARHAGDARAEPGGLRVRRTVAVLSVVVIGATAAQLGGYGRDVNPPFVPRHVDDYLGPTPLLAALSQEILPRGWPGRVLPIRVVEPSGTPGPPVLFAASALLFGFDTAGGYDSVVPRRVTSLTRVLQGEEPETVLRSGLPSAYAPVFDSRTVRLDIVERLGITALATNPEPELETVGTPRGPMPEVTVAYEGADGRLLRVTGASSAPYLVHADEVVRGPGEALRRFLDPGFDFTRSVVIESADLARVDGRRLAGSGTGSVLGASRGINSARVVVNSSEPAWLVFHDSWAPGWTARVNGARQEVIRANYTRRAVAVPAGRSEIQLRYRPPGLATGALVSVITLFVCGAALVVRRESSRRPFPVARPRRRPSRR